MNIIDGIVIKYNGNSGVIVDKDNNEYLLLKNNICNDEIININDHVKFIPEIFKTIEVEERIATFIKKINN